MSLKNENIGIAVGAVIVVIGMVYEPLLRQRLYEPLLRQRRNARR